jgi:hypothetical protein
VLVSPMPDDRTSIEDTDPPAPFLAWSQWQIDITWKAYLGVR